MDAREKGEPAQLQRHLGDMSARPDDLPWYGSVMIQLASRLALLMLVLWALSGLLEPNHDASRLTVAADALEHGLIAFGLVILGAGAAPRLPIWAVGSGVIAIGWAVEGLQHLHWIGGQFQASDLLADLVGALIGAAAVSFGEARAAEALARANASLEF